MPTVRLQMTTLSDLNFKSNVYLLVLDVFNMPISNSATFCFTLLVSFSTGAVVR